MALREEKMESLPIPLLVFSPFPWERGWWHQLPIALFICLSWFPSCLLLCSRGVCHLCGLSSSCPLGAADTAADRPPRLEWKQRSHLYLQHCHRGISQSHPFGFPCQAGFGDHSTCTLSVYNQSDRSLCKVKKGRNISVVVLSDSSFTFPQTLCCILLTWWTAFNVDRGLFLPVV